MGLCQFALGAGKLDYPGLSRSPGGCFLRHPVARATFRLGWAAVQKPLSAPIPRCGLGALPVVEVAWQSLRLVSLLGVISPLVAFAAMR